MRGKELGFVQENHATVKLDSSVASCEIKTYSESRIEQRNVQILKKIQIVNNYSPKWRWLAVDIYRAAKRRGKYPTLATDTEVNSCFSIY